MKRIILWAFVVLAVSLNRATARTIYVDNIAGDDRSRGERPDNQVGFAGPLRTINRALRRAEAGDRIELANSGQPYRESVSLVGAGNSGSPLASFVLNGNGATLDGSRIVPTRAWQHFRGDVFRFLPERMGHQQLFHDGRPLVQRPTATGDRRVPELHALEWCLAPGGIYFCAEPGRVPADYPLSYAWLPTGVTLYKVRDVVIGNLTVQGFQTDGLQCHDAYEIRLAGITARGNGRSGIAVTASSRAALGDCLLGDNGAAQLLVEGYSHTRVKACELFSNTAPAIVRRGGELYLAEEQDGAPSEE
jgi:hypothetical protein